MLPNFSSHLILNYSGKDGDGRTHTYPFSWATGRHPAYSDPQEHCKALSRQEPRKTERWMLLCHSQPSAPYQVKPSWSQDPLQATVFPPWWPYLSSSGNWEHKCRHCGAAQVQQTALESKDYDTNWLGPSLQPLRSEGRAGLPVSKYFPITLLGKKQVFNK